MYVADSHRGQLLMAGKRDGAGLEILGGNLTLVSVLKVYAATIQQGGFSHSQGYKFHIRTTHHMNCFEI